MSIWEVVKYFAIGIALNIAISFLSGSFGANLLETIYWPWIEAGEWLLPSGPEATRCPAVQCSAFWLDFSSIRCSWE